MHLCLRLSSSKEHVTRLNCIDPRAPQARTLVTTRISGLVPGARTEFTLGLIEPDDAVSHVGILCVGL